MNYIGMAVVVITLYVSANCTVIDTALYNNSNDLKLFIKRKLDKTKLAIENIVEDANGLYNKRLKRNSSFMKISYNTTLNYTIEMNDMATFHSLNEIAVLPNETIFNIDNRILREFKLLPKENFSFNFSDVTFMQTYEWQSIIFFIAGMKNGYCFLYTSPSSSSLNFTKRQTIDPPPSIGNYPVNGEFFEDDNQLFLYLIYDRPHHDAVQSMLFKLRNSYLDKEFHNILTNGANAIATFDSGTSTIIVVAHNALSEVGSQVLRFSNHPRKLERIQFLDTYTPSALKHFKLYNENYIFVCEEKSPSYIYWWKGGEFVEWLKVPYVYGHCSFTVKHVQDKTLLFDYSNNEIIIYVFGWKKLDEVKRIPYRPSIDENTSVIAFNLLIDDRIRLYVMSNVSSKINIASWQLIVETAGLNGSWSKNEDPIMECLETVKNDISSIIEKMSLMEKEWSHLLYVNESIPGEVLDYDYSTKFYSGSANELNTTLEKLDNVLHMSNSMVERTNNSNGLNVTVIFNSDLTIKNGILDSLSADSINNIGLENWKIDDYFISLSDQQPIHRISAKNIKMNVLLAEKLGPKNVDDLLPKDSFNKKHNLVLHNLMCKNIIFKNNPLINDIDIRNIVNRRNSTTIKGKKIIQSLQANDILIQSFNEVHFESWIKNNLIEMNGSRPTLERLKLDDNFVIENLYLNTINNISITSVFDNLVFKSENNYIDSDITFYNELKALQLKAYNIIQPEYLKRKVSSQHVEKPSEEFKYSRSVTDQKEKRRYQYSGHIAIDGSLKAQEIICKNCTLIVGNKTVFLDQLDQIYWTHNTKQVIKVPVTIKSPMTVKGNISSTTINGKLLNNLQKVFHNEYKSPMTFITVKVVGNIHDENRNGFNAKKLEDSIVKSSGIQNINGHKNFSRGLTVNRITATNLTEMAPLEGDQTMRSRNAEKTNPSRLVLNGSLIIRGDLEVNEINDWYLKSKLRSAAYIDEDCSLKTMSFKNIKANNMNVRRVNGKLYSELFVNKGISITEAEVDGSITPLELLDIQQVNGHNIKELFPKVVNGSERAVIHGKKTFKSQVIVQNNLSTDFINKIKLHDLFDNTLSKTKEQTITENYTMKDTTYISSLETKMINGIETKDLININGDDAIIIDSDAVFDKLTVNGNVITKTGCTLPKENGPIYINYTRNWSAMNVVGNMYWNKSNDINDRLQSIFENAVTLDKPQTINGNINFLKDVIINNITSTNSTINNISLTHIVSDSVMRDKDNQTIRGDILFINKVFCTDLKVFKNPVVKSINKIDIANFNRTLIRRHVDQTIYGHKHFENGFEAFNLTTEGGVNRVLIKNLVLADTNRTLPNTVFKNLEIRKNLDFEKFNSINFQEFMEERFLLHLKSPQSFNGCLIFEDNVHLEGDALVKTLNNIDIENVIFTKKSGSNTGKNIKGCKTFTQPLYIDGNVYIEKFNNINFSQAYDSSVLTGQPNNIIGNIVFDGELVIDDNICAKSFYINGTNIDLTNAINTYETISKSHFLDDDHS